MRVLPLENLIFFKLIEYNYRKYASPFLGKRNFISDPIPTRGKLSGYAHAHLNITMFQSNLAMWPMGHSFVCELAWEHYIFSQLSLFLFNMGNDMAYIEVYFYIFKPIHRLHVLHKKISNLKFCFLLLVYGVLWNSWYDRNLYNVKITRKLFYALRHVVQVTGSLE